MANEQRGMLASQLIDVLQQGIEKYGDFPVYPESGYTYVAEVEYNKDLFGYHSHGKYTKGEGPHFVLLPFYRDNLSLDITEYSDPLHPEENE